MKITLAQINTIPGNFEANFEQIQKAISEAIKDESDMLVFPELSIPGYGVKDLMYNPGFVANNLSYLDYVCRDSCNYGGHIFVGYIDANTSGSGKPFRNMVAVIHRGIVIARYAKQLLPFYDVFDEGRYFEPGNELCIVDIKGKKVGVVVCEDLWNDKGQDDYNHKENPVEKYRKLEVDYLVSLNSSPYAKNKPLLRNKMMKFILSSSPSLKGIIYCNQYGAQDELVFDGNSMFVGRANIHVAIEPPIVPSGEKYAVGSVNTIDTKHPKSFGYNPNVHFSMLMLGTFDYARKTGLNGIVLGSSGGIDSAVVVAMGTLIFGAENVHAIRMPSVYSSKGSVDDALKLHQNLKCKDYLVPITHKPTIELLNENLKLVGKEYNKVAEENLQSRMRGQVSMYLANAYNLLAVGTCNKCEAATGYFTLFGDSANLFNPLIDLYKLEVYEFARFLNDWVKNAIPTSIMDKPPSAELAPDQEDEKSLMPYDFLDRIVEYYIEKNIATYGEFKGELPEYLHGKVNREDYDNMIRLIERNEFKRRLVAMGPKLTKKAFGTGRRIPVVKG